jgi:hypothetical protein
VFIYDGQRLATVKIFSSVARSTSFFRNALRLPLVSNASTKSIIFLLGYGFVCDECYTYKSMAGTILGFNDYGGKWRKHPWAETPLHSPFSIEILLAVCAEGDIVFVICPHTGECT